MQIEFTLADDTVHALSIITRIVSVTINQLPGLKSVRDQEVDASSVKRRREEQHGTHWGIPPSATKNQRNVGWLAK